MDGFLIKGLNGSGILTLLDISGKTAAAARLHRVVVVWTLMKQIHQMKTDTLKSQAVASL